MVEKKPQSIKKLSQEFRMGQASIKEYLSHLEDIFAKREPLVKAFVPDQLDRFEHLKREFSELESKFPDPLSRPPLYGILLGVKDIYHVDGFPTRAGTQVPPEVIHGPEAESVSILKSNGAVVLGKTVTTEFAYAAPGPTRNPYNLDYTPGGSSSGSAAAVAAGLCPLSLGTQTGGSVIRPASYCGVVGFVSSYGRISTKGVIPLSPSLDRVGFFTTDVEGATMVAKVLCDGWNQVISLPRLVIGTPEGPYLERASEEGLNHFRKILDLLSDGGFEIQPVEMLKNFERIKEQNETLIAAETALVHREWFRDYAALYREKTVNHIKQGQAVSEEVIAACQASREKLRAEILKIMGRNNLSAFLAPAACGPAPRDLGTTGDPVMNLPWSQAGLPAVNLPSGVSQDGLPMGLQIIGSWMDDEILLGLARQIEAMLKP